MVVVVVVVIVLIFEKFCVLTAFQCQGHRIIVICYMALKYSESLPLTFHAFSAKVNANVQFQTRILPESQYFQLIIANCVILCLVFVFMIATELSDTIRKRWDCRAVAAKRCRTKSVLPKHYTWTICLRHRGKWTYQIPLTAPSELKYSKPKTAHMCMLFISSAGESYCKWGFDPPGSRSITRQGNVI